MSNDMDEIKNWYHNNKHIFSWASFFKNANQIAWENQGFDGTLTKSVTPFNSKWLNNIVLKNKLLLMKLLEMMKRVEVINKIDAHKLYYELYILYLRITQKGLTDDYFVAKAKNVEYNPGVHPFLRELYLKNIHSYLISSNLKIFLENTEFAPYFKKIYGSTLKYNQTGKIIGIDEIINESNKVEKIKAINGFYSNDLADCSSLIYLGDGLTDADAWKFITENGGSSILVYQDEEDPLIKIMQEAKIVTDVLEADFSKGVTNLVREENLHQLVKKHPMYKSGQK